jgi:hypothetical protein
MTRFLRRPAEIIREKALDKENGLPQKGCRDRGENSNTRVAGAGIGSAIIAAFQA